MKKALIITYYWPPMGGGGVQRWLKMSKYLSEFGIQPVIFTTENAEGASLDESLLKDVPDGIEVIKCPIWEPFGLYKKLMGKGKNEKIQPGFLEEKKGSSFKQNLSVWVRGNMFIPDAKKFWRKPSIKALKKYLKENDIDYVISTGPPHTTHLIALAIKKKFNIKWVADFRDPWTNIDYYHKLKLSNRADKKHKSLEKEVLTTADEVVTVSWSWAEDFESISGKKPVVITNGFDPADFLDAGKAELDEKFSIAHGGSLNKDRNPYSLWQALNALCEEIEGFKEDLLIRLIGPVDYSAIKLANESGLKQNLVHIENLPHSELVLELCKSQLLLLPLNDTPNVSGVVPGKLYEYMGAKRPILCIGSPTGDSAKIIRQAHAGTVADFGDMNTLKAQIHEAYVAFKKGELKVNATGVNVYSRKQLASNYADLLISL